MVVVDHLGHLLVRTCFTDDRIVFLEFALAKGVQDPIVDFAGDCLLDDVLGSEVDPLELGLVFRDEHRGCLLFVTVEVIDGRDPPGTTRIGYIGRLSDCDAPEFSPFGWVEGV